MSTTKSGRSLRPQTRAVRGGLTRSQHGETSEALYLTSGFAYPDAASAERRFKNEEPGYIYSRFSNPTVAAFEERLTLLEDAPEGVECRGTASGLAAVAAAFLGTLSAGDHVLSSRALFGGCRYIVEELLPRLGIASTLIDGAELKTWEAAIRPNTKAFFLETPSNPALEIFDVKAIADLAHAHGAVLVIDNVFASPIFQKPFTLGADIVVYSATKHIDGQGRCLGGVILGSEKYINETLQPFIRHTGPSLSPMNAWILLKGLETLDLRIAKQCESSLKIAQALQGHAKLAQVSYPTLESFPQYELAKKQMSGGGTMLSFSLAGGKAAAFRFLNALELVLISNNLGDSKSLVTHPATTTHQRLTVEQRAKQGIDEGLIRFSVGLEHADDLIDDLLNALKAV